MRIIIAIISKPFIIALCVISAFLSFLQPAASQDLSSPRFFTFNIQSLSASTVPVVPREALSTFVPNHQAPSFLYELALRFPIKLNGNTRLFGEVAHQNEFFSGIYAFEEGDMGAIEPLELFQTSGSLILLHQFNEQWKLTNVMSFRSNSNQHFDLNRSATGYSNITLFEKKIAKGSLGFGGLVSFNQNITVLPVFKYEVKLNDKWGLDILLPSRALLTRNFSKRTRMFFGARGDAATYFLNGKDGLQNPLVGSNFRRLSINGVVGFEKQLTPMAGFIAEVGATMPFTYGVYDYNQRNLGLHNFQNRVSPHFKVGFFLSLPR